MTELNEERIAGNKIKQMTRWIRDTERTADFSMFEALDGRNSRKPILSYDS